MPQVTTLIEYICAAHVRPDPTGPLITRLDGAWAYCAGHVFDGHAWRRMPPLTRQRLESLPARLELVCRGTDHLMRGLRVSDGHGFLTVVDRHWAYCSAGAPGEAHDFVAIVPIALDEVRHADLARVMRDV